MFVSDSQNKVFSKLTTLDIRGTQATALNALEVAFASAPSVSLSEARDRQRSPPTPAASSGLCTAHQLVRVAAKPAPHDATEVKSALQQTCALPALFVLSDIQVRTESHRRRRGGRGRGGEDRNRAQHDREDEGSTPPNAGSALANAKLSTKKKEALGQVPCKFFRNNGCSAGEACPFAHTLPGEGQPKAVCQWFIKGSCRFGHRCALAHILPGQPMSVRMLVLTISDGPKEQACGTAKCHASRQRSGGTAWRQREKRHISGISYSSCACASPPCGIPWCARCHRRRPAHRFVRLDAGLGYALSFAPICLGQ